MSQADVKMNYLFMQKKESCIVRNEDDDGGEEFVTCDGDFFM